MSLSVLTECVSWCMCLVPMEIRGESVGFQRWWAALWVLGAKLRSSSGAVSVFNSWSISSAFFHFLSKTMSPYVALAGSTWTHRGRSAYFCLLDAGIKDLCCYTQPHLVALGTPRHVLTIETHQSHPEERKRSSLPLNLYLHAYCSLTHDGSRLASEGVSWFWYIHTKEFISAMIWTSLWIQHELVSNALH